MNKEKEIEIKREMVLNTLKKLSNNHYTKEIETQGMLHKIDVFNVGKYEITIRKNALEYIYNNKSLSSLDFYNIDNINITKKSIVFYCTNRTNRWYEKEFFKVILRIK